MTDTGIGVTEYLAQLEEERARLDLIIADMRRRLGLSPSENGGVQPVARAIQAVDVGVGRGSSKVIRSDEFFRMSIPEAVRRYLEIMKQPQTPTAIVGALKAGGVLSQSKNFYTTVWTALKRLRKAGDIVNMSSGWAMSDWYPNKPKGAEEKKSKGGKSRKKGKKVVKSAPKAKVNIKPTPKPKKTGEAPAHVPHSKYNAFMAEQRRAGKSMEEISAAWKKQKAQ